MALGMSLGWYGNEPDRIKYLFPQFGCFIHAQSVSVIESSDIARLCTLGYSDILDIINEIALKVQNPHPQAGTEIASID